MKKGDLELNGKPSAADLEKYLPQLPPELPESYINFIKRHDGGDGDLPVQPLYFILWKLNSLIEYNEGYEIQTYLPGHFAFGGQGGGEFFAFNLETLEIFRVLFAPMHDSAIFVAKNFEEFESMMGFTEENEQ